MIIMCTLLISSATFEDVKNFWTDLNMSQEEATSLAFGNASTSTKMKAEAIQNFESLNTTAEELEAIEQEERDSKMIWGMAFMGILFAMVLLSLIYLVVAVAGGVQP